MEREDAVTLSNEWYELVQGEDAPTDGYEVLQNALHELLPSSVEVGGAAIVDGRPSVLACDSSSLYVLWYLAGLADQPPVVSTNRHPLNDGISVRIEQMYDRERLAQLRRWTFTWPGPDTSLTFEGIVQRRTWSNTGPNGAELVARYAARRIGWALPG